jgi:hypothetical protein
MSFFISSFPSQREFAIHALYKSIIFFVSFFNLFYFVFAETVAFLVVGTVCKTAPAGSCRRDACPQLIKKKRL